MVRRGFKDLSREQTYHVCVVFETQLLQIVLF